MENFVSPGTLDRSDGTCTNQARLYTNARYPVGTDAAVFTLTARAKLVDSQPITTKDVLERLTGCQHLINRGFVDLTSEVVRHDEWGQKDASHE